MCYVVKCFSLIPHLIVQQQTETSMNERRDSSREPQDERTWGQTVYL